MNMTGTLKTSLWIMLLACIFASCSTPKNIAYFQDVQNAEILKIANAENKAIKVEPFDKLSIIVSSKDPALAQIFNLNVITSRTSQGASFNGSGTEFREYSLGVNDGISVFTVSADGTIDYPVLGVLKVEGMTRAELASYIKGQIVGKGLVKDPVVTVEFLNTGVSVMGEVARPGRYDLNADVITIVEALSLAGDLSIQGRRDNITVIRQTGDSVQTYKVDITDAEKVINSPAYYLKQGDVVYVEPNDFRKRQTTNNGNNLMNISFWLSVVSLLTTAAVLLK